MFLRRASIFFAACVLLVVVQYAVAERAGLREDRREGRKGPRIYSFYLQKLDTTMALAAFGKKLERLGWLAFG